MAKARITLTDMGPLTYHGQGYNLERGQNIVTTNEADILHFKCQPGFLVEILEGSAPKASPAPVDEEEAEDDDGDDDDGPADGVLTEKELRKLTKTALLELAEERGVKADVSMKVDDIKAALLDSQSES